MDEMTDTSIAGSGPAPSGAGATGTASSPRADGAVGPLAGGDLAAGRDGEYLPPKRRRAGRRRLILLLAATALAAAGGYEGHHWWTVGRFEVSTNDAYIGANMTLLAAKVSGYVSAVEVTENQPVKAGDVIARIDDGDYRLAVQAARDKIATQEAAIARIAVEAKSAKASIDAARADVQSAKADLSRASLEFDRQSRLVQNNFASRRTLDNARADRDKAVAALSAAEAKLESAEANRAVLDAQRVEAERTLQELRTALAQAERDLSFTVVRAPIDGVIGNKSVEVGRFVQPGARLAAIVPLDRVYVDANFKETQLARMRPGQRVEIAVDAFPDQRFEGEIDSISPASGSLFSLLPPENATGNFTKIVQRLPVRIHFDSEALRQHVLRPGMSVEVTVDTQSDAAAVAGADEATVAASM